MEGNHVEPVAGESWKQVEPIMLMIPPSQASCQAGETEDNKQEGSRGNRGKHNRRTQQHNYSHQ